ncbi:MAG: nucleoside triphosphate pyrophosphohydrolase [Thermoleophilia bacterium]|nr:nucleoside triphosphate pyrophosphohydrolase [Thermoleophilia bacterium]
MKKERILAEVAGLYDLTWRLRRECPWDRRQTQESIVAYTLEEVYELSDTIARREALGDQAVKAELGDLLFQVFFLSCIAEEQGLYDLGDVAACIREKLVRRHPHVFGESRAETPEEVREKWETIKRESEGREGIFHEVPEVFPSTLFAQKLQQRAAAVGFDWLEAREVLAKIREETDEVEREILDAADQQKLRHEIGDLLFAVVNLARKLRVDPELALRQSALRFKERVEAAAQAAGADGLAFEDLSLDEQEAYYQQAKKEQEQ